MSTRELKICLMLALIFGAGLFTGVLLDRKFAAPEPMAGRPRNAGRNAPPRDQVMAEMKATVGFTPQQEERVGKILDGWWDQQKEVRVDAMQKRMAIFEQMMPLVRTNLTSDQIPAFNKMEDRVRRRLRQMLNRAN
jgi:hypothetical protein